MWKLKDSDKQTEDELRKVGKHQFLARILSQKNIKVNEIENFLCTEYEKLSDPYSLNDVEKASKLFVQHVKAKSKVAIIGDYDADGIISSTMLYELCRVFKLQCTVFLPSRLDHGYGLNEKTIEAFKKKVKSPPDLLFVTDCGTSNKLEVDQLRLFGIKTIIIIDHHLPVEDKISKNADALISWHFSKNYNEMCACGEVYQFIRGIRKITKYVNPVEFLSYAAIGTIADSSPIIGDNRIIVKNGLNDYALNHVCASGLNALIKEKNKYSDVLTQSDIEFKIAPVINAAGRIETPDLVFKLLTEYDQSIAKDMAKKISEINDQRKHLQSFIESDAIKKANQYKDKSGVFVYDKNWHIGVVGIVASRVVEETGRPSLVVGYHNGEWKGSGRSIEGVNLKEILDECSHIFVKYGGHAAAVGVTVKEEYLEQAQEIFSNACDLYFSKHELCGEMQRFYVASLKFKAINEEIAMMLLNNLSPYCKKNNEEPVFQLKDVGVTNIAIREGNGWRLVTFDVYKGDEILPYPFKVFSSKYNESLEGKVLDIYFTFPQCWDNSSRFGKFDLTVVDIIEK